MVKILRESMPPIAAPDTLSSRIVTWAWALLLATPMLAVYVAHYLCGPEGGWPTGFLQFDQFYYMANARQHFDSGTFEFLYSLAFSSAQDSPGLYVQPMSLLLGTIHHATGWDPGQIYVAFGCVAAVGFARVAMMLHENVMQQSWRHTRLPVVCFMWGGGVFALAGMVRIAMTDTAFSSAPDSIAVLFHFDPAAGYWFLNLGRNMFYATESFYHVLSLGAVVCVLRGNLRCAAALLAGLCVSHPFSGLQFGAIFLAWGVVEWRRERNASPESRNRALRFLSLTTLIVIGHVTYYLWFLPSHPEHHQLQKQWIDGTADWTLPWLGSLLAYGPLLLLVIWRVVRGDGWRHLWADPTARLLLIWLGVSLGLVNHDLFVKPHQPLHFTRGYVWTPLFLLAVPVLSRLLSAGWQGEARQKLASVLIVAVMLLDNGAWFGLQLRDAFTENKSVGFYLAPTQREVLAILNRRETQDALVVSSDRLLGYLTTIYSPLRAWASHPFNTPNYSDRMHTMVRFFEQDEMPAEWNKEKLVAVALAQFEPRWRARLLARGFRMIGSNANYVVYLREPQELEKKASSQVLKH